ITVTSLLDPAFSISARSALHFFCKLLSPTMKTMTVQSTSGAGTLFFFLALVCAGRRVSLGVVVAAVFIVSSSFVGSGYELAAVVLLYYHTYFSHDSNTQQ